MLRGTGPQDWDPFNDLQPPQRIQSDVGCTNWRAIVGTPVGVWFESDGGLYVLTRKMEVQPSGKFVEDVLATYPDITSASLDMRNGVIVWTANAPLSAEVGGMIVYNWILDCWTTAECSLSRGIPLSFKFVMPVWAGTWR